MKRYLPFLYLTVFTFCSYAQTFSGYQLMEKNSAQSVIRQWQFFGDQNAPLQYHVTDKRITSHPPSGSHTIIRPSFSAMPAFSPNGQFLAVLSMDTPPDQNHQTTTYTVNIYNTELRLLRTLTLPAYYDEGPPMLSLSDRDGSLIIGRAATGDLHFYNSAADQYTELNLFPDADFDLERVMIIRQSGDIIAVLASRRASAPADGAAAHPDSEPHVFVFTPTGTEMTRFRLPGHAANQLQLCKNGEFIAVNSYTAYAQSGRVDRYANLYRISGEQLWQGDILFKLADFSENGRHLLLADNRQWLMLDLPDGSHLLRGKIDNPAEMITAAAAANDGSSALLIARSAFHEGGFVFTEPRLDVSNLIGETVQILRFPEQTYQLPTLYLSPAGDRLQVAFHKSTQLYRKAQ